MSIRSTPRSPRSRRTFQLVAALGALATAAALWLAPLPAAAVETGGAALRQATTPGASPAREAGLTFHRVWSLLVSFWGNSGMSIDPDGNHAPTNTGSTTPPAGAGSGSAPTGVAAATGAPVVALH